MTTSSRGGRERLCFEMAFTFELCILLQFLPIFQARPVVQHQTTVNHPSQSPLVKLTTPVGVAVLYLDSPNPLDHYFDCQDDEGSFSDLVWEKRGGPNRFLTYLVVANESSQLRQLRLDMGLNNTPNVNAGDLGVYTCRNSRSGESLHLNITGGAVAINPIETAHRILLDTSTTLGVYVSAFTTLTSENITWTHPNGIRIVSAQQFTLRESNSQLHVKNATGDLTGMYIVQVMVEIDGETFIETAAIQLFVNTSIYIYHRQLTHTPEPNIHEEEVVGVAALSLSGPQVINHFFDCENIEGNASDLYWEKRSGTNRFPSAIVGNRLRLDMAPGSGAVFYSDLDVYTCRDSVTGQSVSIDMQGGSIALIASGYKPTGRFTVPIGGDVSFKVRVAGIPPVLGHHIRWSRASSHAITPRRDFMLLEENRQLFVEEATEEDEGLYHVQIARNVLGTYNETKFLSFRLSLLRNTITMIHRRIIHQPNPVHHSSPVVGVVALNLDETDETANHSLDCTTSLGIVSDLVWEKLTEENHSAVLLPVEIVANHLRLSLSNPDISNLGVYRCRNVKTSERTLINITGGSVGINSEHSLYEAVVGNTISLGIHVAGFPPLSAEEIEWHNPHDSVITSGRALTLLNNKTRLQIQGVQFTDNGTYSIQINRPFHNVSTTIDLIVHKQRSIVASNPPGESVIVRSGLSSNIAFECDNFDETGSRLILTKWFIILANMTRYEVPVLLPDAHIGGTPTRDGNISTYNNRLIIRRFLYNLNFAILFCGNQSNSYILRFHLRLYTHPQLIHISDPFKYVERELPNFRVNLEGTRKAVISPPALAWLFFPEGSQHGHFLRNDSRRIFDFANATFLTLNHSDSGTYVLRIRERQNAFYNASDLRGLAVGSFKLKVLYGPLIDPGPSVQQVDLSDVPISLLCGTNLRGAPMPSVTWRHPTGAIIRANDSSYSLINNQTGVMLRFRVTYMDLGAWVCILRSEEPDSRRQSGKVFVGEANITIQLSLPLVEGVYSVLSTPNNTVIIRRLGEQNNMTFRCSIYTSEGIQEPTLWMINNIRMVLNERSNTSIFGGRSNYSFQGSTRLPNSSSDTYTDHLRINVFIEELVGAELYCLRTNRMLMARYPLETYVPPRLFLPSTRIAVIEGSSFFLNLEREPSAVPFPSFYFWYHNTVILRNDSRRISGYAYLDFLIAYQSDSGSYRFIVNNYYLNGEPLGTDDADFHLDVLSGPTLRLGPSRVAANRSRAVSLLCGTLLSVHSEYSITWFGAHGARIHNSDVSNRMMVDDETGIRLNFTNYVSGDEGLYTCVVKVIGRNVATSNGVVPSLVVGERTHTIILYNADATISGMYIISIPKNNSPIIAPEGAVSYRIRCSVYRGSGTQVKTYWSLKRPNSPLPIDIFYTLRGISDLTFSSPYFDYMTISSFPTVLDGYILTCGTIIGGNVFANQFLIILYNEPNLSDLRTPLISPEGHNLTVNLEEHLMATPFPVFNWTLNGVIQNNDSRRTLGYPDIVFHEVHRSHAGEYILTASNHIPNVHVSDMGSFTLEVYYGPDIVSRPSEVVSTIGRTAVLRCGHTIISNPLPTVSWYRPYMSNPVASDDEDIIIINDDMNRVYRLVIRSVRLSDVGFWTCEVKVEGNVTTGQSGTLSSVLIGVQSHAISLSVNRVYDVTIFSSLPNNTVILKARGEVNVTVECAVFNGDGTQLITDWSLTDDNMGVIIEPKYFLRSTTAVVYEGTPQFQENEDFYLPTFQNRLIILRYSALLHGLTLNCGVGGYGGNLFLHRYPLTTFTAPTLKTLPDTVNVLEGISIYFDLTVPPLPAPYPEFEWLWNGEVQHNDSRRTFGYPRLSFSAVNRSDVGNYTLRVTNYFLTGTREVIGSSTGSFVLDVIYPFTAVRGDMRQVFRLGSVANFTCATNISGNPPPAIFWHYREGFKNLSDYPHYLSVRDEAGVRLVITGVGVEDVGTYSCELRVVVRNVHTSEDTVTPIYNQTWQSSSQLHLESLTSRINLVTSHPDGVVIAPPGERNVTIRCSLYNQQRVQQYTTWSAKAARLPDLRDYLIRKFNAHSLYIGNMRETILIFEFHRSMNGLQFYCGPTNNWTFHRFVFHRQYEPFFLVRGLPLSFRESSNAMVIPQLPPYGFPFPYSYNWTRYGLMQHNDSRRKFGYPGMILTPILRSDAGWYNFSLRNWPTRTYTGYFYLDVEYGPELERAPFIQGVTLGEPVLILFGYHLKSNPRPNLRWRRPPDEIPDQPGYRYILNQEKVGINIECMSIADIGGWHGILSVTTYDNPLNRSDGSLHQFHGSYLVDSEDTSPKPHGLNATGVGSTWVMLEWFVPAPFRSITFHASFRFYNYIVLAVDHTSMGGVTVSAPLRYAVGDRHPRFNVTHLSPSTTYKIVVTTRVDKIRIAMERQDELGYFSDPITVTTLAHLQPAFASEDTSARNGISNDSRLNIGLTAVVVVVANSILLVIVLITVFSLKKLRK